MNPALSALLLCGGKGERLRPLTDRLPKPLVPVCGKPILGYIVEQLKRYGVKHVVVATGYKSAQIEDYLSKYHPELDVDLVNSGDVDIIERINAAAPFLRNDFLLLYGDTIADVNVFDLVRFHRRAPGSMTVTMWPLRTQFGVLAVNDSGRVTDYEEKPVLDKWINIGYFYVEERVVLSLGGFRSFRGFLRHMVFEAKELNGYKHRGMHITVNTLKELEDAEQHVMRLGIKQRLLRV